MRFLIRILFTTIFTLTLFTSAFASAENNPNGYDSMYRYSVLENKVSFGNLENKVDSLAEKSQKINALPDDGAKKLQDITDKQNFSTQQIDNSLKNIKNRSRVKTSLIGNKLGTLKFQMIQIKDQATSLEALALKTEYTKNKIQIASQVRFLKEEQIKVENFIREKEDEFSLFGWLVNSL